MHITDGYLLITLNFYPKHLVYNIFDKRLPFLHQRTLLHLAAETAHIKILDYLVEQGADLNNQDHNGVLICYHTYQDICSLACEKFKPSIRNVYVLRLC